MRKEWIQGRDIGVSGKQLWDLVRDGLQPHYKSEKAKPPPDVRRESALLGQDIKRLAEMKERLDPYSIEWAPSFDELESANHAGRYENLKFEADDLEKEIKTRENVLREKHPYSWAGYSLPASDEQIEDVYDELFNSMYLEDKVKQALEQGRIDYALLTAVYRQGQELYILSTDGFRWGARGVEATHRKKALVSAYIKNSDKLPLINREMLEDDSIYANNYDFRKRIPGKIVRNYLNQKGIKTNYQKMIKKIESQIK